MAGAPLEALSLQETHVGDLSFLRGMPLKMLALDGCLEATGYQTLADIKTLEVLTLPYIDSRTEEDFKAIGALRDHPSLRQIEEDGLTMAKGVFPITAEAKEEFWLKYDDLTRIREATAMAVTLARQGRYSESANLLREQVIRPTHFWNWEALGLVLFASGDHAGYQTICNEMMQRFRHRVEGDESSVRLSLLSPDSGVPMAELRALMPHMALVRDDTPFLCFFLLTNGLLEYRDGHYAEAIELLRKVSSERFSWTEAAANVVLSMVYYRRGEIQTAMTALNRAHDAIAAVWPSGHTASNGGFNWFFAYLLLQEAEKLIAGSGNSQALK